MPPKDKAKSLINRFYYALPNNGSLKIGLMNCAQRWQEAIKCAWICADELKKDAKDDYDINYYKEVQEIITNDGTNN